MATSIECAQELDIKVSKKEYTIVGDEIYTKTTVDTMPQWLSDVISSTVDGIVGAKVIELDTAIASIQTSLSELAIAKNQYEQLINIDAKIDAVVISKLDTTNSTVAVNAANVVDLTATKASLIDASALAIQQIDSSIANGSIGSELLRVETTSAALASANSTSITDMSAAFGAGTAAIQQILSTQAGVYSTSANAITELDAMLVDENGAPIRGSATVSNILEVTDKSAQASFAYDTLLTVGGVNYSSGFGLATSATLNSGIAAGSSEFWINANKFKFTNSGQTGANAPFSIDATGLVPQITFNGLVDFTNTNASGTTSIDGGLITTGKVSSVSGNTYFDLNNNQIKMNNGTFILDSNAAGTSAEPNILGGYIKGGTIEVDGSGEIRSSNFSGVAGFYLQGATGNAYFNNVFLNRDLQIETGSYTIRLYTTYSTDAQGNALRDTGIASDTTQIAFTYASINNVTSLSSSEDYRLETNARAYNIQYSPSGTLPVGNQWGTLTCDEKLVTIDSMVSDGTGTFDNTFSVKGDITTVFNQVVNYKIIQYVDVRVIWALKKIT